MKSYQSIKAQIAKLEKQAEALRANQQQGAIAQINKLMADFGLTASDLVAGGKAKKAAPVKAKAKVAKRGAAAKPAKAKVTVGAAKYRDPKTQKTWTGRGKPPNWILGAKNRDTFLIDGAPAAAVAVAAAPKKAAASTKSATKAVVKRATKPAAKPAKKVGRKVGKKSAPATPAQEAAAPAAA